MRVPDEKLAEVCDRGFTVVESFLDKDTLAAAQDALWEIYPRPEDYFADPETYAKYAKTQFAGLRFFPYSSWALNRVAVYPDLIDAAERFLQTKEIDCYKIELWAKYSGAIDYDQIHHRDYENHTIVVPRADQLMPQMTCFILLSDVTELDGPTKAVPLEKTRHIPIGISAHQDRRLLRATRSRSTGPAGIDADLQDRRLPPRLELQGAGPFAVRHAGGLQAARLALAGQARLAGPTPNNPAGRRRWSR